MRGADLMIDPPASQCFLGKRKQGFVFTATLALRFGGFASLGVQLAPYKISASFKSDFS
jgi:hypothetical protein